MKRTPEVAISVETDSSWGRELVLGVADFAACHGPWNLVLEPRDSTTLDLLERWHGEGVIAKISTPLQLEQLRNSQ
ncbi:MAG: XylR family transcriptional regulator, partial [Planctomycetota bacterium]